ncbi:DUF6155 family protein [Clostridium ganghwense]|uniref:DUF6155 family protein n=1 Tax=Clostridium ganghwense TaxID=312089 RepID=A0ABT4CQN3_9CLOT|nr:DUF6155 family protein [Clostridium ganghwense]MCY6371357.1 DUF6155 family protein [Clostridium ganghwense]
MKENKYKQYINSLKDNELKKDIYDLIKLFPQVREYYDLRINPKLEKELLNKYKHIIKQEFFPQKEDVKMRYSVVSEAIIEFQRKATIPSNAAELMLYYVEIALKFTESYGDIGEKFYISVEGVFDKALNYILKNGLEDEFYKEAKKLVLRSKGIGWDFEDNMEEIFYKYFD